MEEKSNNPKKWIVISAVNFFTGGPLTILLECLSFLENDKNICSNYSILALVYDNNLLPKYKNIQVRSFPKPRGSWLHKLLHEYVNSKKISKENDVYLWFSLHDMTPSVIAKRRAVYCHNPAPFYKLTKREKQFDRGFALFNNFYKYLYSLNIKKNNYVIVQQEWIRKAFTNMFDVPSKKIIVAHPNVNIQRTEVFTDANDLVRFFYPALPRFFKNFEVIINAVNIVEQKTNLPFEVILTIHGNENKYAIYIKTRAIHLPQVNFVGLQNKEGINEWYQRCSCVLFSSKLETWGLPITEAKLYRKPLLVADLPYAKETVGTYDKVSFFEPENAEMLADLMIQFLNKNLIFNGNQEVIPDEPFSENWKQTFQLLLQ